MALSSLSSDICFNKRGGSTFYHNASWNRQNASLASKQHSNKPKWTFTDLAEISLVICLKLGISYYLHWARLPSQLRMQRGKQLHLACKIICKRQSLMKEMKPNCQCNQKCKQCPMPVIAAFLSVPSAPLCFLLLSLDMNLTCSVLVLEIC